MNDWPQSELSYFFRVKVLAFSPSSFEARFTMNAPRIMPMTRRLGVQPKWIPEEIISGHSGAIANVLTS